MGKALVGMGRASAAMAVAVAWRMVEERKQPRIRALVTNNVVDWPHNDVANAAHFFLERLKGAFERQERADGLFLDMMAVVTMTAFAMEGYANFIGSALIERTVKDAADADEAWAAFEKKRTKDKIKAIRRMTGTTINWNARPYSSLRDLTDLRNMFAHPKAHRPEQQEFEAVGTDGELRKMLREYRPDYERRLTWEFVQIAYEDVEAIWAQLLEAAGIKAHETWSGGSQGFSLIEVLDARE